jgi:hypothetical protein
MLGAFIGISSAVTHELPVAMAWIFTMVAVAFVGIVFMVLVYFSAPRATALSDDPDDDRQGDPR